MTKKFTFKQLFSLVDGRLSTSIDDVYDMLNHITDESLMTHHLPVALDYLKLKNPKWFTEQKEILDKFKIKVGEEFKILMKEIEEYNPFIEIPQLKDEFDTSDFETFMINNSLIA